MVIPYFKRGELIKKILECFKDKPSTVDEISDYLFQILLLIVTL